MTCTHFKIIDLEGKQKRNKISETGEATPTKIGVHELDINPYLHEFFESLPIN